MVTGSGVRLFALLSLRGRLKLTIDTGLPWRIPASRGLRAHFPGETFPRSTADQLAWLEDRIEEEFGPLHDRYTDRKEAPMPETIAIPTALALRIIRLADAWADPAERTGWTRPDDLPDADACDLLTALVDEAATLADILARAPEEAAAHA